MMRGTLTHEDRAILHRIHGPEGTGRLGASNIMDQICIGVCARPAASRSPSDVRVRQFCNAFRGLPVDEAAQSMRNA